MYEPLTEFKGKGKPKKNFLLSEGKINLKANNSATQPAKKTQKNYIIRSEDQKCISDYFKKSEPNLSDTAIDSLNIKSELNSFNTENPKEICLQVDEKISEEIKTSNINMNKEHQKNCKRKRSSDSSGSGEKRQKKNSENIKLKMIDLFGDDDSNNTFAVNHENINKGNSVEGKKCKLEDENEDDFKIKFSTKERARVSDLVVKNLMPIYRQKRLITSKDEFKTVAKEMSKFLLETKGPKISENFSSSLNLI